MSLLRRVVVLLCMTALAEAAPAPPHPPAFARFEAWRQQFDPANASPLDLTAGGRLARERAEAMQQLILTDPERAIALALPETQRASLPQTIRDQIERHVSGHGDLMVGVADDFERGRSRTFRDATLEGKTFQAFVYGRRTEQVSRTNIPLSGIVLADLMAVGDEPGPP